MIVLFSSMIANVVTTVMTFPLDTVKTRLQSRSRPTEAKTVSWQGVFNGALPVVMMSAPCCGLYFALYETLRLRDPIHSLSHDILRACIAQLFVGPLVVPTDLLKVSLTSAAIRFAVRR